jgi:hypothetical protein
MPPGGIDPGQIRLVLEHEMAGFRDDAPTGITWDPLPPELVLESPT